MNLVFILAIVAFIVLYKLFKEFGKVKHNATSQIEEMLKSTMIKIQDQTEKKEPFELLTIKKYFPEYENSSFYNDMSVLFDKIYNAFAESKHDVLKEFLAQSLYEEFSDQIRKRQEKNLRQELFLNHLSTEICHMKTFHDRVEVTLDFRVSQMSALINEDNISFDNPSKIYIDVSHKWTFTREIKGNSSWILVKTSSSAI